MLRQHQGCTVNSPGALDSAPRHVLRYLLTCISNHTLCVTTWRAHGHLGHSLSRTLHFPQDLLHFLCYPLELKAPLPALGSGGGGGMGSGVSFPALTAYIQPTALFSAIPLKSLTDAQIHLFVFVLLLVPQQGLTFLSEAVHGSISFFSLPSHRQSLPNCSCNGVSKGSNPHAPLLLLRTYLPCWIKHVGNIYCLDYLIRFYPPSSLE